MKKIIVVIFSAISFSGFAQVYVAETCTVSFFSETKMENIDASNTVAKPVLNTATNELLFKLSNKAFRFKSSLMEEHFNENYMESEKYPFTIFKGKVNEKIDYTKDGTYEVTVTGMLSMHGVDKERTIKGTIIIKDGKITMQSKFMVKLEDHKIKVPSVVGANIAEEVEVKVDAVLIPYKKH